LLVTVGLRLPWTGWVTLAGTPLYWTRLHLPTHGCRCVALPWLHGLLTFTPLPLVLWFYIRRFGWLHCPTHVTVCPHICPISAGCSAPRVHRTFPARACAFVIAVTLPPCWVTLRFRLRTTYGWFTRCGSRTFGLRALTLPGLATRLPTLPPWFPTHIHCLLRCVTTRARYRGNFALLRLPRGYCYADVYGRTVGSVARGFCPWFTACLQVDYIRYPGLPTHTACAVLTLVPRTPHVAVHLPLHCRGCTWFPIRLVCSPGLPRSCCRCAHLTLPFPVGWSSFCHTFAAHLAHPTPLAFCPYPLVLTHLGCYLLPRSSGWLQVMHLLHTHYGYAWLLHAVALRF